MPPTAVPTAISPHITTLKTDPTDPYGPSGMFGSAGSNRPSVRLIACPQPIQ
ncbi:hypothetical protein GCM10010988_24960 [Cnuibacter physcomitrellae]|nr:hypothetical protein GCM10010988_24960 [Cnuibacter physcomitrellae]